MASRLIAGALKASYKVSHRSKHLVSPLMVNIRTFGLFSKDRDDEKEKEAAHLELREAVRELSQGLARPKTSSSNSTLQEMDTSPLQDLEVDQLEELARAHYEGEIDGSDASMEKAVIIWTEAAKRGSAESQCTAWPYVIAKGMELSRIHKSLQYDARASE